eukprot:Nitzschia sp. Nitz4//scaffold94_size78252//34841//37933//NITZ4_005469-RA/size78252-augustus-gene-0.72-mRNA-1//-1//CDS//3329560383//3752//frame0
MESASNTSTAILTSLPTLDALRLQGTNSAWIRPEGSNLDVLQNGTDASTVLAICHLDNLVPFSFPDKMPRPIIWEDAAGIALAAHHLNVGDGSIIPEVEGLPERCNIRFTVEFANTEITQSVTLEHMVEALSREPGSPTERLPCSYTGAFTSANTIPSSILSGLRGYPQISGRSTSSDLDDKSQFPLFARTVPPDSGNSVPIILFLHHVLKIEHLAVVNVNDSFGNSFVQGLRNAAILYAPDLEILQVTVETSQSDWIQGALQRIKDSEFRYTFALLYGQDHHDQFFEAAYDMGMAGNGDYSWFLGDTYTQFNDGRVFEPNSTLSLAYRGVGQIQASGGIRDIGLDNFDKFMATYETLNNPDDLHYLYSLMPWEDPKIYPDTFVDESDFSLPSLGLHTPFLYEAVVALGLAACETVGSGASTADDLRLSGTDHYETLVNSRIHGIVNDLVFDPSTGSREPNSTLYRVSNVIPGETSTNGNITSDEVCTHVFVDGTWQEVTPFMFGDGTFTIPPDIPPLHEVKTNLSIALQVCVLVLSFIVFVLVAACMGWSYMHRKTRVVLASQPIFLHIICVGLTVFASAMIPLVLDHKVLSEEGCSRACTAVPWLLTLGFSITVSALLTKTHRVNILLLNTRTAKGLKRIKVTAMDVAKPMIALVSVNTILLSLMTALGSPYFEFVVKGVDVFDRPNDVHGICNYSDSVPYLSTMCGLNFLALLFAIGEGYQARNLATEFSESKHIFKALIAIALVAFVAAPVMLLARDNANTFVFALSALLFVGSISILLLLFVPKMQHLRDIENPGPDRRRSVVGLSNRWDQSDRFSMPMTQFGGGHVRISGLESSPFPASSLFASSVEDFGRDPENGSNNSKEDDTKSQALEALTGMKVLSMKSRPELLREIEQLRAVLKRKRAAEKANKANRSSHRQDMSSNDLHLEGDQEDGNQTAESAEDPEVSPEDEEALEDTNESSSQSLTTGTGANTGSSMPEQYTIEEGAVNHGEDSIKAKTDAR